MATSSQKPLTFQEFQPSLSAKTLEVIDELGFKYLTPVQASTIPLFLQHKDVCVEATTGSGKTLSFGIPVYEMLLKVTPSLQKYDVGALILAPTRELAVQIFEVFQIFSRHHTNLTCALFVGGTSIQENATDYQQHGGNIIVGTPGRIIDITSRLTMINYKRLEVLILDEADKLLDMGFKDAINQILTFLPKQRRTGLFSATQTKELTELARAGLRNPVQISVKVQHSLPKATKKSSSTTPITATSVAAAAQNIPLSLENYYLLCEYEERPFHLLNFIQNHPHDKIIIFCATCACVEYYSLVLSQLMKEAQIYLKQRKSTTITTTQTKEEEEEEGKQKNSKKNKKEKKNHNNKSEQQPMEIDQTNNNNNNKNNHYQSSSMDEMFEKLTTSFPVNSIEFIPFHGKMISKKRTLLFQKFKNLTKGGVMISTDVAARGIDIPDVDWIIQLAAPKDPSFFVHRIGRTARAGKKGGAIIYLTKEEESYVELLRGRGVPLTSLTTTDSSSSSSSSSSLYHSHLCTIMPSYSSQDILELFKFISKNDRDALENGSTAFISFIRAYKENLCSYIFRLESLDIGGLARAYGLLRLPKIAETRGVKGKPIIFQTDPLDTSLIPYKNPEKEKARLRRIQQAKEAELQALEGNNNDDNDDEEGDGSDIDSEDNQTKKSSFTTATGRMKKEWIPAEEFIRTEKKRERKKKQSFIAKMKDEWDELAAEEAMFKKLRKGKISQEMYEDGLFSEDIRKYQEDNDEHENEDDQDSEGDQDGPKRKKSRQEESSEEDDDGDDDSDEEDAPLLLRGNNKNKGKINNNHNNSNHRPGGKKPFNQHHQHHQHHRGGRPGSSHKKNNNNRSFQRR